MKRYITLDMQNIQENELKITHWILLENIDFLQNNPTGWCFASRASLAKWLGIGDRNIYKLLDILLDKRLIEIHVKTKHIRITEKYRKMASCKKEEGMQKVQTSSAKSADEGMQKVQSLPIKKENEEREEERTTTKKSFNHYMDVLDFLQENGYHNKKIRIEFEGIKVGVSEYGKAYNLTNLNDLPRKQETRFLTYLKNNPSLLEGK